MNVFRILGDSSHTASKCILIWAILSNKSAEGMSFFELHLVFFFCFFWPGGALGFEGSWLISLREILSFSLRANRYLVDNASALCCCVLHAIPRPVLEGRPSLEHCVKDLLHLFFLFYHLSDDKSLRPDKRAREGLEAWGYRVGRCHVCRAVCDAYRQRHTWNYCGRGKVVESFLRGTVGVFC